MLAGGRPEQIEAARRDAARAGVDDVVIFAGQRPAEEIPAYLDAADVLVSPRSTGTNTPLKIYQYLRSGCPIVATRLLTHTQVLDDSVSFLTAPTAEGFANGILAALADPLKARAVGTPGASARRNEIQLRVVPGAHAARLRAPERRRHGAGRRRRRVSAPRTDHYSYSVYADPAMAESFEGLRFSGPIGRLIAESQERVLAGFLAPVKGRTVLDVGTGTGRAAIALARRGASVTGVDASKEMLDVARVRAAEAHVTVTFASGDAHGLAFENQSFDDVVCLRVLMHTPDWRQSLGELCRVARNRVVFDYPALASAAALQALTRRVAAAAGARVEAYRVFSDRAVHATLRAAGVPGDRERQAVRAANRAAQGDRLSGRDVAGRGRARTAWPSLDAGIAGDDRGGALRVLVTGATGFTGGHLARALASGGYAVRAFVRDPAQAASFSDFPGIEPAVGTSKIARRSIAQSAASTSSITSPRFTGRPACRMLDTARSMPRPCDR